MEEILRIPVVVGDDEKDLDVVYEDEIVTFRLNGKELFRMDYWGNLLPAMNRMLDIWGSEPEE